MTRITSLLLACGSALLIVAAVSAARPQYSGTLRIAIDSTPRAIDPYAADAAMARQVSPQVFEPLLVVDPAGGLKPMLALSWASAPDGWRIVLRPGVRLHDGSVLTPAAVVTALRTRFPEWQITAVGETLTIAPGAGPVDVPWALAQRSSVIAVRVPAGEWIGTGPFRVAQLTATRLTLAAHDPYWNGRPFVDAIEVDLGRSRTQQLSDLEVGRLDIAALQPMDVRRAEQRQLRTSASRPVDLVALVFEPHRAADGAAVRDTLSAAFDRTAIARVVVQGGAEPATSVLPRWLAGATVTPEPGRVLARASVTSLPLEQRTVVLRVPAGDAAARAIADRLVVDAQQAGFAMTVQVPTGGVQPRADARLVRLPVDVTMPDRALAGVMAVLGPRTMTAVAVAPPLAGATVEEVARTERTMLERRVVVPIVHVPEIVAASPRVMSWASALMQPGGEWDLADTWLRPSPATVP